MNQRMTGAMALAASAVATVALAHTGASGVVLERMKGMSGLKDALAELAPMMQGTVPYDTFLVSEGASIISGHAGDTMLSLFPEGSLEGVTYARPDIWSNWQDFAALANDLRMYADALAVAAPNGLAPAPRPQGAMAGMDHSVMTMTPEPAAEPGFTVAELMGYDEKRPEALATRSTFDPGTPALDLTTLAADDLFTLIAATCSSCHAQFRAGRD